MLYFKRIDFSEEIMLIKQVNQKSAIFVTTGIFQGNDLIFNHMYAKLMQNINLIGKVELIYIKSYCHIWKLLKKF